MYITSSSVVPMMFSLMATSSANHDVVFANRADDKFNDAVLNPVTVPHTSLNPKVRAQREKYHEQLITRFDSDVPLEVKQFWFISSMLDPRYKKLVFKNDNMLTQGMRRDAVKWLTEAYNKNFKGKVAKAATTTRRLPLRHLKPSSSGARSRLRASSERRALMTKHQTGMRQSWRSSKNTWHCRKSR